MDELFIKKIRTAARAGWWTVLIAYCILLIQWFAYLTIMEKQPSVMICFWGGDITWPQIRAIWLWAMVIYKLIIAMMIFICIWLTLWVRQLKKSKP